MKNRLLKLIVFTRYPEPGKTKTRLIPILGKEGAAQLQSSMTEDIIASVMQLQHRQSLSTEIRYDGGTRVLMQQWLGNKLAYNPQGKGDLGARMCRAFRASFRSGIERVIIIGTDSPDLRINFVQQAFEVLTKSDVVLGPSQDGGYYLIGFNKKGFLPEIFENIAWGKRTVFSNTISILNKTDRTVHLLPQWYDIDTANDLREFVERHQGSAFKSRTFSYLQKKLRKTCIRR